MGAMGTASLEGLRLGIPVLRLDISYKPITADYRYQWPWEAGEVNFGDFLTKAYFEEGNTTLDQRLDLASTQYDNLSKSAFDYYLKNHALMNVTAKFLSYCKDAQFRFSDFKPKELSKGTIRALYEYLTY